jgi:SAM-dependent methyltransferase
LSVERLVPGTKEWDAFLPDHFAPYLFAKEYCKGLRVLDAGTGVGYGAAILKSFGAATVRAIDIDAKTIETARQLYGALGIDYLVDDCERLSQLDGQYDLICNFENIEHLQHQPIFGGIDEEARAGRLLLTTHGLFEDHGCPFDYWRWTVHRLAQMIKQVGFDISAIKRTTTGRRATIFLTERHLGSMRSSFVGAYGKTLALGIRAIKKAGSRRLHELVDASFNSCRVVDAKQSATSYICVGVLALRT